jgi:DNA-binding PadR family transcriptional regulator
MLSGNLKLLVLKLVSSKEMSGYDLMKSIKQKTGNKPSPGSMYPVLEDLKKGSYITVREVGRAKKYSITEQGKKHVSEFAKQKQELINKIRTAVGVFCTLTGNSEEECLQTLHQECMKTKQEKKKKIRTKDAKKTKART